MPQGAKKARAKDSVSPYKRELAERIATAFKQFNANARRGNEIGQLELSRLVAKKLHRPEPFTQAAVSGWMNVEKPSAPDNPTLRAIADVLGVDLMWLVFGAQED
jgi:hypothetical protein